MLTFERAMVLQDISEEEWPAQLMSVLSRKTRAAFVEVDPRAEYAAIEEVILAQFEITLEASRIRLTEIKNDAQRDPGDIFLVMKKLVKWWLIPTEEPLEDDKDRLKQLEETVIECVTCVQYLNNLSRSAQTWLLNWNLTDVNDMTQQMREYKLIQWGTCYHYKTRRERGNTRLKWPIIPKQVDIKKEKTKIKDKKNVTATNAQRSNTMPATVPRRYSNLRLKVYWYWYRNWCLHWYK